MLTSDKVRAEIETWSAANPIHVGWGWHCTAHGGNAVIRLLKAAGATVDMPNDEKGTAYIIVNGITLNPWGEYRSFIEGWDEIGRALGLPFDVVATLLEESERQTRFDAKAGDFVTDHGAGTDAMKQYVETYLLPVVERLEERRPMKDAVADMTTPDPFMALAETAYSSMGPEEALRNLRLCEMVPEGERNDLNRALVGYGQSKKAEWEEEAHFNLLRDMEEARAKSWKRTCTHLSELQDAYRREQRHERAEDSYQQIVAKQRQGLGLPKPCPAKV